MPSTFSQSLRLELIATGEKSGTWGVLTNNNLGDLVEQAVTGFTSLDVTGGNITLTALNGVVDQSRSAVLLVSGTPGTTRILTIPNVKKPYTVRNTADSTVQVKTAGGVAFDVPRNAFAYIYCDGSNNVIGRVITDAANTITSSPAPFNSPAFTGTPTAPTAGAGTNTTQLATTAFVQAALAATVPAGVILMWSGSIATIPSGWLLCNGSNGTPDLRDRFVVGAGSAYAVGATGGANTVTLSTANLPAHTHSISGSGTTSGQSQSHTHTGTTSTADLAHTHSGTTGNQSQDHTHSGTTASENQNHTHGFSGTTGGGGAHSHTYDRTFRGSGFDVEDGNSFTLFESGATTSGVGDHVHGFSGTTGGISNNHQHAFSTGGVSANHTHAFTTGGMSANATHSHTVTTGNASQDHTHTFSFSGTSGSTGSATAIDIRPLHYALAYIMKT